MKSLTKTLIVAFALLLMVLPNVIAEPQLTIDLLKYEPIPAQPGQYITVYLELENAGDEDTSNAALKIVDQFPFTTVSAAEAEKFVGVLKSQQSVVYSFLIRVDSAAVVGNNDLKIMFTDDVISGDWQESDASIEVKSDDATLSIASITTSPEEVNPGDDVSLQLELKNSADVVLRNIVLDLDLVTTQGTAVVDLPFIPTTSSAQKTISKLNPGETTSLTFDLKAYPTATPGYYKIPFNLNFYDEEGTEFSQDDFASIIVGAAPELEIYFEKSTLRKDSVEGDITLKFVNKGVNDLKFLDIELVDTDSYDVLTNNKEYLGDLDSDDYRSETFTIKPNVQNPDLSFRIEYKDENNKDYSFSVSTPLQYDQTSKEQRNYTGILVLVLVLVVVGLWYWRRRHHKRKH